MPFPKKRGCATCDHLIIKGSGLIVRLEKDTRVEVKEARAQQLAPTELQITPGL